MPPPFLPMHPSTHGLSALDCPFPLLLPSRFSHRGVAFHACCVHVPFLQRVKHTIVEIDEGADGTGAEEHTLTEFVTYIQVDKGAFLRDCRVRCAGAGKLMHCGEVNIALHHHTQILHPLFAQPCCGVYLGTARTIP